MFRAGIDREPNCRAAQPQGVGYAARDRLVGVAFAHRHIVAVELEDQRDFAGKIPCPGFQESQRGGISVAAGLDGQLEMVARIVRRRVHGKAACRTVLEPLIHRKHDKSACPGQTAVVQYPGQVGERAGIVAAVPTQDFAYSIVHDWSPVY